jgi:hypothetical protein
MLQRTLISRSNGTVLETYGPLGWVLREGGPGAIPPYKEFRKSHLPLTEEDLKDSSDLMKEAIKNGANVEELRNGALKWLKGEKKQGASQRKKPKKCEPW